ncbi:MAG: hypothetical protein AB2L24_03195 [Mangrovibacterium sp.]
MSLPDNRAYSQECNDVTLGEARKLYELGKFPEVVDKLEYCLEKGFTKGKRSRLTGCWLFLIWLSIQSLRPISIRCGYFRSILLMKLICLTPPSFIELVNQLKGAGGALMVTSVSKKAENIDEVPATIVVITVSRSGNVVIRTWLNF